MKLMLHSKANVYAVEINRITFGQCEDILDAIDIDLSLIHIQMCIRDRKIELFDKLIDSASCWKNEFRTAFGMRPDPAFVGQLAMSSNKTNAENNKKGNQNNDGGDGNAE